MLLRQLFLGPEGAEPLGGFRLFPASWFRSTQWQRLAGQFSCCAAQRLGEVALALSRF